MIELLLKDLANPHTVSQIVIMLFALFAKDAIVALLRSYQQKAKTDKDPNNDAAGIAAGAIADSLEKVSIKKK